jgi:hypothetical protein
MAYRIAKSLGKLRSQANSRWPTRNKASDGWIGDPAHFARGAASDHNPHVRDGSTGVVTALDLTHDPNSGCDAGVLADVLIASRDPRIKYIIWNKRIISGDAGPSPWARRKYSGKNPHNMHVHISVKRAKAHYDDDAAWALPGAAPPPRRRQRRRRRPGLRSGRRSEGGQNTQRMSATCRNSSA